MSSFFMALRSDLTAVLYFDILPVWGEYKGVPIVFIAKLTTGL